MLHSVLAHGAGHEVTVHYLHGPNFPSRAKSLLSEMIDRGGGSASFYEISDAEVAGLPTLEFISSPMWYRIFLPDLLPAQERVLYLDVDTLAVDSLEPLWEMDLAENYLGAVTNVFQLDHLRHAADLGLEDPRAYFNSGVLLMNLDLMRRDGCAATLRDFAIANASELVWPDQDALNLVLGARRLELHPRWNCMNSVLQFPWSPYVFGSEAVSEARLNPGIRHFEGPAINKPWHYLCDGPMRQLYFAHREQTPWAAVQLQGVTPRNVLKLKARRAARRIAALARRVRTRFGISS